MRLLCCLHVARDKWLCNVVFHRVPPEAFVETTKSMINLIEKKALHDFESVDHREQISFYSGRGLQEYYKTNSTDILI